MTVPAVATTPMEAPPRLDAAEEGAADEGSFAALLSKEAEAPAEDEGGEAAEGDAQAAADLLTGETTGEVASEADADLLAQLLGSVLGDLPSTGQNAQGVSEAPPAEAAPAARPLQAALAEASTRPQAKALPEERSVPAVAPELPKAEAGRTAPLAAVEDGEPVLDPAALAAKASAQPAVAGRAESQAPRPVEGQNAAPAPSPTPAAEVRAQAQTQPAEASADRRDEGEAQDDPKAGLAKTLTSEETPREVATGSRFAELVQPSAVSTDRAEALPNPTPTLTPPVIGPVVPAQTSTTALPPSIPAGAPSEVIPLHVEWLTARGGGTARLQLDPPNLGEVEVSVTVRGSAVDVVVRAADPAAQLAVAQTRELLADGLAARDLRIDSFDVRGSGNESQPDSSSNSRDPANLSSGQGRRENDDDGTQRQTGSPGGDGGLASPDLSHISNSTRPGSSGVDLHI